MQIFWINQWISWIKNVECAISFLSQLSLSEICARRWPTEESFCVLIWIEKWLLKHIDSHQRWTIDHSVTSWNANETKWSNENSALDQLFMSTCEIEKFYLLMQILRASLDFCSSSKDLIEWYSNEYLYVTQ